MARNHFTASKHIIRKAGSAHNRYRSNTLPRSLPIHRKQRAGTPQNSTRAHGSMELCMHAMPYVSSLRAIWAEDEHGDILQYAVYRNMMLSMMMS